MFTDLNLESTTTISGLTSIRHDDDETDILATVNSPHTRLIPKNPDTPGTKHSRDERKSFTDNDSDILAPPPIPLRRPQISLFENLQQDLNTSSHHSVQLFRDDDYMDTTPQSSNNIKDNNNIDDSESGFIYFEESSSSSTKSTENHQGDIEQHKPEDKQVVIDEGIIVPKKSFYYDVEQASVGGNNTGEYNDKVKKEDEKQGRHRHKQQKSKNKMKQFTSSMMMATETTTTYSSSSSAAKYTKASESYKRNAFLRTLRRHKVIKSIQVLLACYVCFLTYANIGPPGGLQDNKTGLIIDQTSPERTNRGVILVNGVERAIVGATTFQVGCIGITRMTAFFMYPALALVFITKFRATISFLSQTPLSMFMCSDVHKLHLYCGWTIFIGSLIHAIFHMARWAQQGNLVALLFRHISGLTGFIALISLLLICIPMFPMFKQYFKYEIRKSLHYFFIIFCLVLIFHVSPAAIPNGGFTAYIFGTLFVWYCIDNFYCYAFMSEKIETTQFQVLPNGVHMTMQVSKRFQNSIQGGYCYVCFPWIDKNQWHAFSLFENPYNRQQRQIFVQNVGDWTNKVHNVLQRNTVRPVWVQGPFPSPYDNAQEYDNQILVASGIGITPALSVIRSHQDSRRINLIWAVRDRHLLEFFLHHLYLDHCGWNLIFYTGKDKLLDEVIDVYTNTNVCIVQGRPNLHQVIPNIIYGIESQLGLPERYVPDKKVAISEQILETINEGMKKDEKLRHRMGSSKNSDNKVGDRNDNDGCADYDYNDDGASDNLSIKSQELSAIANVAANFGFQVAKPTPSELDSDDKDKKLAAPTTSFSTFLKHHHDDHDDHRKRKSRVLSSYLELSFLPWKYQEEAHEYVKNLDRQYVLPTWGILYCGGTKKLEKSLKQVAHEYDIALTVESFAW